MTSRRNNTALFIAALSACLGIVLASAHAPAYARQAATTAGQSQTLKRAPECFVAKRSPERTMRQAVIGNSSFTASDYRLQPETIYQNTKPLSERHQAFILTHLPRASLIAEPALQSAN